MKKIIGFAGQMRSGKDTCADYLALKLNETACNNLLSGENSLWWKRVAFATGVKRVFMDVFDKDIDFAKKYKVTRHTIYKIRETYDIPSRSDRILKVIRSMDIGKSTIRDISKKLGIKYQNLYKIIKDNSIL